MKIYEIKNLKRLYSAIILFLFATLFVFAFSYMSAEKEVNATAYKLIEFTSDKGNIKFSYPDFFVLKEQTFSPGEILFHTDLLPKNKNISTHGLIEVWNLENNHFKNPAEFLEDSFNTSSLPLTDLTKTNISVNGMDGYIYKYFLSGSEDNQYMALEGFLFNDNKIYRVSLFFKSHNEKNHQSTGTLKQRSEENDYKIFENILHSVRNG